MEVFSRRLPVAGAGNGASQPKESGPVMAPEEVQSLFCRRLSTICARFEAWSSPICVTGLVGEVSADRWRRREATPLLDRKTGTPLLLDIPPALLEEDGLHAGEPVRAWGLLRAHLHQGQVVPRLEVLSIQRDRMVEAARQQAALMRTLRDSPPQRRDFPVREEARMLLLGAGVGKERLRALQQALGGFWTARNVDLRHVLPGEEQALADSLRRMEQDILFLVLGDGGWPARGGTVLLKAILDCPACRVLACEASLPRPDAESPAWESGLDAVLPCLVEAYFASTAEAVSHIRQKSGDIRRKRDEDRARQEELAALRASLAALTDRPVEPEPRPAWLFLLIGMVSGMTLLLAGWWSVLHLA